MTPPPPAAGSAFARALDAFNLRLQSLKAGLNPGEFSWYPYDTLGSFFELDRLLSGAGRNLLSLATGGPVLDLGCADGDLSFFLESQGLRVDAVDYEPTNFNHLRGVRALGEALGSAVRIHSLDVDRPFELPQHVYSVAFCMGLLYHLKNPFCLLEHLSRHARYGVLTTRVARFTPDRHVALAAYPVGYLLDADESNGDATNFWIFSEAGLRRLLQRTNWDVCEFHTLGDTEASDPATLTGDERALCLLRSRACRAVQAGMRPQFLEGWYEVEQDFWRWTARRFTARFRPQPAVAGGSLALWFNLQSWQVERLGPITLRARLNGYDLPPCTYGQPGEQLYAASLPAQCAGAGELLVEFTVDKATPPAGAEKRELGLVVLSLALQ